MGRAWILLLADAHLQLRNYPDAEAALQLIKEGSFHPRSIGRDNICSVARALGAARAAEAPAVAAQICFRWPKEQVPRI
jgi:hypothetical protein